MSVDMDDLETDAARLSRANGWVLCDTSSGVADALRLEPTNGLAIKALVEPPVVLTPTEDEWATGDAELAWAL